MTLRPMLYSPIVVWCLLACSNGASNGNPGSGNDAHGAASAGGSGATPNGAGSSGASGGSGAMPGSAGMTSSAGASGVAPGSCGSDSDSPSARSWCDPKTWGGTLPTATTDVVIDGEIVVDCVATARSVEIPAGATLKAARAKDSQLTLRGNLVVHGRLDYGAPDDRVCDATAELVLSGMDDESFSGTPSAGEFGGGTPGEFPDPQDVPMQVVAGDFGVWVMGSGVFTAAGRAKRAWSKLTQTAAPEATTFSVEDATGWQTDDRVALTPTALSSVSEHYLQFDEGTLATIDGNDATLAQAPTFEHLGCTDCVRRGEAANLTRNVVVRSADDSAHGHIMVAEQGVLQFDSVELRWLGPQKKCSIGGPARRAPIYFHEQGEASAESFVRHASIWGGNNHFLMIEKSHGIEIADIAGYDTIGSGFSMFFDKSYCNTRCNHIEDYVPHQIVFNDVLAAKVAVPQREDCNAIGGTEGIVPSGGEGTGCQNCVATGVAYNFGKYGNEGAINLAEGGSGRPLDFVLNGSVAHNNAGNGISNWQNGSNMTPAYENDQTWSNGANGIHHGAYTNPYEFKNLTSLDNAGTDFAVIAIQSDPSRPRLDGALLDGFRTLPYFLVPTQPVVVVNVKFTGVADPAITQVQDVCSGGDEDDPDDGTCIRNWLHFENPQIPAGVKPFFFGWHENKHSSWEVRNFSHPDYPDLPSDFDLYRRDNEVSGGSYFEIFDAWLVPR
jgi:hypothetical protein